MKPRQVPIFLYWRVENVQFWINSIGHLGWLSCILNFPRFHKNVNSLELWKYRRIYTTFILGTALQNFGTRANSFGHGPLDLHDKICSSFFNVDFWNGTPETRTALLNLWVPALIWQRFTCDFKRASGISGALLRAVQKKRKTLQILECKMQLYGSLLWKSENVCHSCGTKQGHPLHRSVHALKHKAIPGCIIPDVVNRTFGNRTQLLDWVRLDSVIELTKMFQFDYVRLPNQSNDWVRSWVFGSVRGLTTPG